MSAFFCYQKVRRETLKKEHPKLANKDVVSVHINDKSLENGRRMARI
jgi:hypothetical protein